MEYVSLLPPEEKQKRLNTRRRTRLLLLVFVLGIIFLLLYTFLFAAFIFQRRNLSTLRDERIGLEEQAAALEDYEQLHLEAEEAVAILNRAMDTPPPWEGLLGVVGESLQPEAWLVEMDASTGSEGGRARLAGNAHGYGSLAGALDRLEDVTELSTPEIRSTRRVVENGRDLVRFELEAVLRPGPPYYQPGEEGS